LCWVGINGHLSDESERYKQDFSDGLRTWCKHISKLMKEHSSKLEFEKAHSYKIKLDTLKELEVQGWTCTCKEVQQESVRDKETFEVETTSFDYRGLW
jgi:excinuclease UvrABC nuclease subunit